MLNKEPKKILLVGGAGFIGSHLGQKLMEMGHMVRIIDPLLVLSGIDESWLRIVQDYRLNKLLRGASLHYGSFEKIGWEVCSVWKPDIIVHLGAVPLEGNKSESMEEHQIIKDANLTYQVAKLARQYSIKRVVYMSSLFAYGNFISPIVDEDHPINPITPYGIDKATGEFIIKTIVPEWSIIRTTSIYGFGDANLRSTSLILDKALQGKSFWVNSSAMLDFIYINDLIEGITKVIFSPKAANEDFHISGGLALPLTDYVKEVKKYIEELQYEVKDINDRPARGTMGNSKAKDLLGWSPKYNLQTGVEEYIKIAKEFNCG